MTGDGLGPRALTLRELNRRIAGLVSVPETQDVWVTAELSDVRVSGGHCYMELVEKNEATGGVEARLRGIIWANAYGRISVEFSSVTGSRLSTGMKVMVRGSVNYHAAFGLSLVIIGINPEFTIGDVARRRREILDRLMREGVAEDNRRLAWPTLANRIAVISAKGAAGYGDFINHLYANPRNLRFKSKLFAAVMQGERTARSVIDALERIMAECEQWDCVVIIRGGGATSDLLAFDDYDLASSVAQFPLPVVVGIGHERDVTVLDYVANMRVKTPTAAAEWLIGHGEGALDRLRELALEIGRAAVDKTGGSRTQLAYCEGLLPVAARGVIERANVRMGRGAMSVSGVIGRRISSELSRLSHYVEMVGVGGENAIKNQRERLDARVRLVEVLSPQSTLNRGYSLTLVNGRAVKSAAEVVPGSVIETLLADGTVRSVVE